jgi:hypothetical protein
MNRVEKYLETVSCLENLNIFEYEILIIEDFKDKIRQRYKNIEYELDRAEYDGITTINTNLEGQLEILQWILKL